jgi:hypothetical protein
VQLDKFPKAVFDVSAMVLESGGSDLAVLVTAASVALADAGVELYDLVPAVQVVSDLRCVAAACSMYRSVLDRVFTFPSGVPCYAESQDSRSDQPSYSVDFMCI